VSQVDTNPVWVRFVSYPFTWVARQGEWLRWLLAIVGLLMVGVTTVLVMYTPADAPVSQEASYAAVIITGAVFIGASLSGIVQSLFTAEGQPVPNTNERDTN
jgi:hypothetical protein